jgi:DNA-binding transcriptional regulator YiaG
MAHLNRSKAAKERHRRERRRRNYMPLPKYVPPTGEQIRALRTALGMTQPTFARQIEVGEVQVSVWENKHKSPSRRNARRMASLAYNNGIEWAPIEQFIPGKTRSLDPEPLKPLPIPAWLPRPKEKHT